MHWYILDKCCPLGCGQESITLAWAQQQQYFQYVFWLYNGWQAVERKNNAINNMSDVEQLYAEGEVIISEYLLTDVVGGQYSLIITEPGVSKCLSIITQGILSLHIDLFLKFLFFSVLKMSQEIKLHNANITSTGRWLWRNSL